MRDAVFSSFRIAAGLLLAVLLSVVECHVPSVEFDSLGRGTCPRIEVQPSFNGTMDTAKRERKHRYFHLLQSRMIITVADELKDCSLLKWYRAG